MNNDLDPNTEQLVIDLAASFSERIVNGEHVHIQEYLDKLPDNASRKAFQTLTNMTKFLTTIEITEREESFTDEPREGIEIIPR